MGDLTDSFSRAEFRCKCGCGRDNISLDLVKKLQRLRNSYGKPIIINSGCRCKKHNAEVGGVPDSAHVCEGKEGEAADIHVENPIDAWEIIDLCMSLNLFKRIGVGKTLVHVDVSTTLPNPRIWPYGDK